MGARSLAMGRARPTKPRRTTIPEVVSQKATTRYCPRRTTRGGRVTATPDHRMTSGSDPVAVATIRCAARRCRANPKGGGPRRGPRCHVPRRGQRARGASDNLLSPQVGPWDGALETLRDVNWDGWSVGEGTPPQAGGGDPGRPTSTSHLTGKRTATTHRQVLSRGAGDTRAPGNGPPGQTEDVVKQRRGLRPSNKPARGGPAWRGRTHRTGAAVVGGTSGTTGPVRERGRTPAAVGQAAEPRGTLSTNTGCRWRQRFWRRRGMERPVGSSGRHCGGPPGGPRRAGTARSGAGQSREALATQSGKARRRDAEAQKRSGDHAEKRWRRRIRQPATRRDAAR